MTLPPMASAALRRAEGRGEHEQVALVGVRELGSGLAARGLRRGVRQHDHDELAVHALDQIRRRRARPRRRDALQRRDSQLGGGENLRDVVPQLLRVAVREVVAAVRAARPADGAPGRGGGTLLEERLGPLRSTPLVELYGGSVVILKPPSSLVN